MKVPTCWETYSWLAIFPFMLPYWIPALPPPSSGFRKPTLEGVCRTPLETQGGQLCRTATFCDPRGFLCLGQRPVNDRLVARFHRLRRVRSPGGRSLADYEGGGC